MILHHSDTIVNELKKINKFALKNREIIFACIGTDRSTGDSLGPLVGTQLEKHGYHVLGTLEKPLHALNLEERILDIKEKYPNHFILAIDACVGNESDIGKIVVQNNGIYPGKGVGKKLPMVGDACVKGIISTSKCLHFVRLYDVITMCNNIADSCHEMMLKRKQLTVLNNSKKLKKKKKRMNSFKVMLDFTKM